MKVCTEVIVFLGVPSKMDTLGAFHLISGVGQGFYPRVRFFLFIDSVILFFFSPTRRFSYFKSKIFFHGSICDVKSHNYLMCTSSHEYHI
jgi:hypothetical protein